MLSLEQINEIIKSDLVDSNFAITLKRVGFETKRHLGNL